MVACLAVTDAAEPTAGRFAVEVPIRVQWGDMDALGHVNNARYFT